MITTAIGVVADVLGSFMDGVVDEHDRNGVVYLPSAIELGHKVLDALIAEGYLLVEMPENGEKPSCWVRPIEASA